MRTPRSWKFSVPLVRVNGGKPARVRLLFWNAMAPLTLASRRVQRDQQSEVERGVSLRFGAVGDAPIQPFTGLAFA